MPFSSHDESKKQENKTTTSQLLSVHMSPVLKEDGVAVSASNADTKNGVNDRESKAIILAAKRGDEVAFRRLILEPIKKSDIEELKEIRREKINNHLRGVPAFFALGIVTGVPGVWYSIFVWGELAPSLMTLWSGGGVMAGVSAFGIVGTTLLCVGLTVVSVGGILVGAKWLVDAARESYQFNKKYLNPAIAKRNLMKQQRSESTIEFARKRQKVKSPDVHQHSERSQSTEEQKPSSGRIPSRRRSR